MDAPVKLAKVIKCVLGPGLGGTLRGMGVCGCRMETQLRAQHGKVVFAGLRASPHARQHCATSERWDGAELAFPAGSPP